MRLGIRTKLLLTLLTALVAVVAAMTLLMQWSFDRGFLRYVDTVEQERLDLLGDALEQAYTEHGSWTYLHAEANAWPHLLLSTLPHGQLDPQQRARLERRMVRIGRNLPHQSAGLGPRFEERVFLLDVNRQLVSGPANGEEREDLQTLTVNTRIVGYLGLLPHRSLSDHRQLRFVEEQRRSFFFISLLIAAAALCLSFPLARSLARRIMVLAQGTHSLAGGHFDSRIIDRSEDELGQLARDFNTLAQTLEENENARRQWVADISHELRTPLAILRGEIEALRDGVRSATPGAIASLHSETLRLQRLVEDLYQLARSDVGVLTYHHQPVELKGLLQRAAKGFSTELENKGIHLQLLLPASELWVEADLERLQQLFTNLLENTVRYTDRGGAAEIRLQRSAHLALIDLLDSAPAVPESALAHLFERLYRVEGSRNRASGGAGLGLAICSTIVAAHNGRISAQPSPLGGLWIRIELPLAGGN